MQTHQTTLWPPRIRRADASRYLLETHGLSFAPSTLAKMAVLGGGPAFQKNGNIPLYATESLDDWASERLTKSVKSTSELPGYSRKAKPSEGGN